MKRQSFLALDIGSRSVRGFGIVADGIAVKTHLHTTSFGTRAQNMAGTIDAIEDGLGVKFKETRVTGNFGTVRSGFGRNTISFGRLHKITDKDVQNAIFNAPDLKNLDGQTTLHLIPIQLLVDGEHDVRKTNNVLCHSMTARFHSISYPDQIIDEIKKGLWTASLPATDFFDPIYILSRAYPSVKKPILFIDFGKTSTKAGVATNRGLISRFDIEVGQDDATKNIAYEFGLTDAAAEEIKVMVLSQKPAAADRYTLADAKYPALTRHDAREQWFEVNNRIVDAVMDKVREKEFDIFITGHNANTENINSLILKNKGFDNATILDEYAIAGALGEIFKKNIGVKKQRMFGKRVGKAIPIIPSIMCWPIGGSHVYDMFRSVGIRAAHMDIMDGFYTKKVSGTLDDLARVRTAAGPKTHIQTHLMVEDPLIWIDSALKAGADSIILSSGTRHIVESLKRIKEYGKRCGLAIHPDWDLKNLKPELLTMLDDIIVMSVVPGASGQKFMPDALARIRTLRNTRDKYGFKYKLIVDGGINDETAPDCWKAGADFLISGSYLRKRPDFADAVLKLLPKQ